MAEKEKLRIDKYLWAIRLFKTRTLASDACKAGRVKLAGQNIKPSHEVKLNEVYSISKGPERKIIIVTGLLEMRVDAKTADAKAMNVLKLETAMANTSLSPVELRDPVKNYNKFAVKDFQKQVPDIDLADALKALGGGHAG